MSDVTCRFLFSFLIFSCSFFSLSVVYIFSYPVKVLYSQSRFFCFKRTSVYKLNKLLSVRVSLLSCSVILLLTNCTSCTMFSVPNKMMMMMMMIWAGEQERQKVKKVKNRHRGVTLYNTYNNQIWHEGSCRRCNHLCQILLKSVEGFLSCGGPKMGVFH